MNKVVMPADVWEAWCLDYERLKNNKCDIKKVIFNNPTTIVFWKDNTKTIVKCMKGDKFDKEKGIAMAFMKKACGNTSKYLKIIKEMIAKSEGEKMKNYPTLKVKLLSDNAKVPTRGTAGSSGLDVYSTVDTVIAPRGDVLIPLDLCFDIPFGWDLCVYNKSGISTKKKLDKGAELIDSDYTGNCHVHLFNCSDNAVEIKKGDKIAQLVMREVWMGALEVVEEIQKDTERGSGGFGSTGER